MLDTSAYFWDDTPSGRDPDTYSETLASYHERLWSKPLPNGTPFTLTRTPGPPFYFEFGEFLLSSDTGVNSLWNTSTQQAHVAVAHIIDRVPMAERERFDRRMYSIGSMIIWPCVRRGGNTINQQRGSSSKIRDRFDLTLECIRRHYASRDSPLGNTLARYVDYLELFVDFYGFVEFFHLQDALNGDGQIKFWLPFDGFEGSPYPADLAEYQEFREHAIEFIDARAQRMAAWESRQSAAPRGAPR
jgi:hypothetical protein